MRARAAFDLTPSMQAAIEELERLISTRFPDATYELELGDDPDGLRLIPTVAVEDTLDIFDIVGEHLLQYQIDDGLPIYVSPARPPAMEHALAQTRLREAEVTSSPD